METNRYDALLKGDKLFQGNPCARGHSGVRSAKSQCCLECRKLTRERWKSENKAYYDELVKAYYKNNKNEILAKAKERRDADPETRKKKSRQYYQDNIERMREHGRNYYYRNVDKVKEGNRSRYTGTQTFRKSGKPVAVDRALRRAREFDRAIQLNDDDLKTLIDLRSRGCAYCGSNEKLHLDHKVPVSRGGNHDLDNLQWLCQFHNLSKGYKSHDQYVIWCSEVGRKLPLLENESEITILDFQNSKGGLSDFTALDRYLSALFS